MAKANMAHASAVSNTRREVIAGAAAVAVASVAAAHVAGDAAADHPDAHLFALWREYQSARSRSRQLNDEREALLQAVWADNPKPELVTRWENTRGHWNGREWEGTPERDALIADLDSQGLTLEDVARMDYDRWQIVQQSFADRGGAALEAEEAAIGDIEDGAAAAVKDTPAKTLDGLRLKLRLLTHHSNLPGEDEKPQGFGDSIFLAIVADVEAMGGRFHV